MRKISISKIVNEQINNFLINESLTRVLYHFTDIDALDNIVKYDAFSLGCSYNYEEEDMGSKKNFFGCFTRQKNGKMGISSWYNVRIEVDGDLLNQRYSGKAVNYYNEVGGKNGYYLRFKEKNEKIPYEQEETENEDRLFSNEGIIKNFSKYVVKIDVLVTNKLDGNLIRELLRDKNYGDKIKVYEDEESFRLGDGCIINNAVSFLYNGEPHRIEEGKTLGIYLSKLMSYLSTACQVPQDQRYDFMIKLFNKFKLNDCIEIIDEDILYTVDETINVGVILDCIMRSDNDTQHKEKISRLFNYITRRLKMMNTK